MAINAPIKEFTLPHSYLSVDLGDDLYQSFSYGGSRIFNGEKKPIVEIAVELGFDDRNLHSMHMGNEICNKDLIVVQIGVSLDKVVDLDKIQ